MRPLKPCIIDWVKIRVLIRYVLQYRSLEVERSQTIKLCIYLCIYLFISCCCFLVILQVCCCFYKCCGVKKEATKLIKSCRFSLRWHEEPLKYAWVLRKPWKNWSQNSGPTEVNGNFAADCNWDKQDFTCCQSLIFYPILYFFPLLWILCIVFLLLPHLFFCLLQQRYENIPPGTTGRSHGNGDILHRCSDIPPAFRRTHRALLCTRCLQPGSQWGLTQSRGWKSSVVFDLIHLPGLQVCHVVAMSFWSK